MIHIHFNKSAVYLIILLIPVFKTNNELPTESEKYLRITLANTEFKHAEQKDNYLNYDFSPLWLKTSNFSVVGFVGPDYRRIQIKILSAIKITANPNIYFITGKSRVTNSICDFNGTIKILHIRELRKFKMRVDEIVSPARREGVLLTEYFLAENKMQAKTGIFTGVMRTNWYVDKKGKLRYDDISESSDYFSNNQFVGVWTAYKNNKTLRCNWGDYRIPNAGNFDIGAGEFSPNDKYLTKGWQTYSRDEKYWW